MNSSLTKKNTKNYKFFLHWLFTYTFLIGLITFFIQGTNVPWGDLLSFKNFGSFSYTIFRLSTHQIFLALLVSLPFFILFSVFYFPIFKKKKRNLFIILLAFLVLIQALFLFTSILDTYVFRLYKMRLNEVTLPMIFSLGLDSVIEFIKNSGDMGLTYLIFLLSVITSLGLATWIWTTKFKLGFKSVFLYLTVYTLCQIVHGFSNAYGYNPILSQNHYLQHPLFKLTFDSRLRKLGLMHFREKRTLNLITTKPNFFSSVLKYPKNTLQYDSLPLSSRPNIFIIVLDSIRFDMLNKEIMPNLWAFKNKNIEFLHHYSTGNTSILGLFGIFYGISPIYYSAIRNSSIRPLLINKLLSENYFINAYTYHTLRSAQLDTTAFAGLKKESNRFSAFTSTSFPTWKRDQEITDLFLKSLNEKPKKQPQFNLLFLGAAHDFSAPSPETSKFQPIVPVLRRLTLSHQSPVEPILNLYKSSVFFLDQLIGKILTSLENGGWMENSIVIVTSDHGQEINKLKMGNWEHLSNFSDWQIRIPMVMHWPGKKAQTINHVTSHLDLVPTFFQENFNCLNPIQDYSSGQNLFKPPLHKKKRLLFVSGWRGNAIITGKKVYSLQLLEGVQVFDSLTYKEKKEESKNIPLLLKFMTHSKKQFL